MTKINFGRMIDNLKYFYPENMTEKDALGYIKKGGFADRLYEKTYFVYYSPRKNYRPTINYLLGEFETIGKAQSYTKKVFKTDERLKSEIESVYLKIKAST